MSSAAGLFAHPRARLSRTLGSAVVAFLAALVGTGGAEAAAAPDASFRLSTPARCLVAACRVSVGYGDRGLLRGVLVEVDWDHGGPDAAAGFGTDVRLRCVPPL